MSKIPRLAKAEVRTTTLVDTQGRPVPVLALVMWKQDMGDPPEKMTELPALVLELDQARWLGKTLLETVALVDSTPPASSAGTH